MRSSLRLFSSSFQEEEDKWNAAYISQTINEQFDESPEFPNCCGINVLYGFEAFHESDIKKHADVFVQYIQDNEGQRQALCLIAINHLQLPVMKPILKKAKYKLIDKGTNYGHEGHTVFLYSKCLNTTRKRG